MSTVKAAPVPSPRAVTAPTVVVPPAIPAANVRSCEPPSRVVILMLPPFESRLTAPVDKVNAPKVMPSKLLQFKPSRVTLPNRVVPTEPLARVTSPSNRTLVAAPAVKPEFAPNVF